MSYGKFSKYHKRIFDKTGIGENILYRIISLHIFVAGRDTGNPFPNLLTLSQAAQELVLGTEILRY